MDMKKILKAVDNASSNKPAEGSNDMKRFMHIVESNNRLTQAENFIIQESPRPITQPMLNKNKNYNPNMIGKYFRTVETELAESQQRKEDRATRLAKRVTERVTIGADGKVTGGFKPSAPNPDADSSPVPAKPPSGGNVIPQASVILGGTEYRVVLQGDIRGRRAPPPGAPRVTAQGYIEGDVITLTIDPPTDMKESVAGPKQCWPGHRKVGTKPGTGKNAGKRVNACKKIKGK